MGHGVWALPGLLGHFLQVASVSPSVAWAAVMCAAALRATWGGHHCPGDW